MHPTLFAEPPVPSSPQSDERQLLERLSAGDRQALATLVERYQQRVGSLARRLLGWQDGADDVAQEVFLAAWQKARQYRGQARLETWHVALTLNRCRTLARRRYVRERFLRLAQSAGRRSGDAADPASALQRSELLAGPSRGPTPTVGRAMPPAVPVFLSPSALYSAARPRPRRR